MNYTTLSGIDTLLLAARYIEQYGDTIPTASPDGSVYVGPYCAKPSGGPLHVVTPHDGSLRYTSVALSELASEFAQVSIHDPFRSESSSPAFSPPSSPCPSSADSDYAASLQSSNSASSRKSSPGIGRKVVTKFPKKAAHKGAKVAIVGGKAFNITTTGQREEKWKQSIERISGAIATTPNSPVKESSRRLLEKVYDDITSHPPEFWTKIIAARIKDRTPAQVNVWFSNRRQWYGAGDTFQGRYIEESEELKYNRRKTVKLRPAALEMSREWSDSFFDDVVALYLDKELQDTLQEECETKRKTIPRYKGKSKKGHKYE